MIKAEFSISNIKFVVEEKDDANKLCDKVKSIIYNFTSVTSKEDPDVQK